MMIKQKIFTTLIAVLTCSTPFLGAQEWPLYDFAPQAPIGTVGSTRGWCPRPYLNDVILDNDINISIGYRRDICENQIRAFDEESFLITRENMKIHDLALTEFGLRLNYVFDDICGCYWFRNFVIKGSIYYGIAGQGEYHDKIHDDESGDYFYSTGIVNESIIHKGHSIDGSIGLGYLFPFHFECIGNFGFVPIGGWSYNRLDLGMKNAEINGHGSSSSTSSSSSSFFPPDDSSSSSSSRFPEEGLTFNQKWEGPWAGLDVIYQRCDFSLKLSGEYHWAHWKADWILRGHDIIGTRDFSNRRTSSHAHGYVAAADFRWQIQRWWNVDIGFKYTRFSLKNGRLTPREDEIRFIQLGLLDQKDVVKHALWHSFAVTVDLGYNF
jgi:hypothetical protein